jgi:type IV pilus assembly protein PilA
VRRERRNLPESEAGFTLIELLVTMLILGALAAIAMPAFFSQTEKAGDARAKEEVHTVQVAIETYATEHEGSYKGATKAKLEAIEPALKSAGSLTVNKAKPAAYKVTVTGSASTQKFWIENDEGDRSFGCKKKGVGGCPKSGDWG